MEDVSRAFSSHLLASTLSNTLICASQGEEQVLFLGLATEAFRRSRGGHTKSEFLFVAMEPVEDEGQLDPYRGDVARSASGAEHKKFPDRCGLYRIDPDEKQKIKDLDDLTMDISPTPRQRRGRKAQQIRLRFAHINGTESRVGPILTTHVLGNFERVWLSRSEDHLKGSCWGLKASASALPHKRKTTVGGEPPSPSPSLQMKSVSKVFSSNLSSVTLDTTLLCLNGDALKLGFRAEPPTRRKDPQTIGDEVDLRSASERGAMQVDSVDAKRKADSEPVEAPLPKTAKSEGEEVSQWDHLPPKKRYLKTNK
ncbi:hypothetical protein FOZ63_028564 [Perkinsus olseni]|uniref:Uncharacterized protein n=1 Tax=Perkinsus olseni TaxID=32597 RepID=A0A7J6R645_PEROL|nr:hypothetical protein FOZ63_028564 [Perkinsus olseni]